MSRIANISPHHSGGDGLLGAFFGAKNVPKGLPPPQRRELTVFFDRKESPCMIPLPLRQAKRNPPGAFRGGFMFRSHQ